MGLKDGQQGDWWLDVEKVDVEMELRRLEGRK